MFLNPVLRSAGGEPTPLVARVNLGGTWLLRGGLVFAGVAGGEEGARGFLDAYKVSNGERMWRVWTIPAQIRAARRAPSTAARMAAATFSRACFRCARRRVR